MRPEFDEEKVQVMAQSETISTINISKHNVRIACKFHQDATVTIYSFS